MTLTKADIVNHLLESEVFSKADAARIVESLLELMKSQLESGENIKISGFGKFMVRDKKSRRGRNPHTGEDLMLAPRRVITFHPSGILRDRVNKKNLMKH